MKTLYQAISTQITTEVPEVTHVKLFNNQFNRMEQGEEQAFPVHEAVFVEFVSPIPWRTKREGIQEADLTVRIHIGFESLLLEDLTVFDRKSAIHEALQGFKDNYFTAFVRVSETQDTDHSNYMVWTIDYQTTYTDISTYTRRNFVEANVTTLTVNADLDIDNQVIRTGDGA